MHGRRVKGRVAGVINWLAALSTHPRDVGKWEIIRRSVGSDDDNKQYQLHRYYVGASFRFLESR